MKRFTLLLLVSALLFAAPGCRRGAGAGTPRPPILLPNEKELIIPSIFTEEELGEAVKNRPKIALTGTSGPDNDKGEFSFPAEAFEEGAKLEWAPASTDVEKAMQAQAKVQFAKKAQEIDHKRKFDYLEKMYDAYMAYVNKFEPALQTHEHFKIYLRREKKMPLRRKIESGAMDVVFHAESNLPNRILAYIPSPVATNSYFVIRSNRKTDIVANLTILLNDQELKAVRGFFTNYINEIESKKPPETRDLEKFMSYLKVASTPTVNNFLLEKTHALNFAGSLRNAGTIVVCRTELETTEVNRRVIVIGHRAVNPFDDAGRYVMPPEVQAFMPREAPPPPKKEAGGGGIPLLK